MMKISGFHIRVENRKLQHTFRTAVRETNEFQEVLLELESEGGSAFGSACESSKVSGSTVGGIIAVLEKHLCPAIVSQDIHHYQLLDYLHTLIPGNYCAKAALDIAIHELWAKNNGGNLGDLLGMYRREIPTNMTISLDTTDKMVKAAEDHVASGFCSLKIKLDKDPRGIETLKEIRKAVGDDIAIRVDMNQSWRAKEAIRYIHKMESISLEFVEQPVAKDDLAGLAMVTESVDIPIVADESVHHYQSALQIVQNRMADVINIKLMKCGGLYPARKIIHLAELHGIECMIGCMMEGELSIRAAIYLAACEKNLVYYDLDSLFFTGNPSVSDNLIQYQPIIVVG